MGVNFVRLGLSPGMAATFTLPSLLGPQSAARMLLTGDLLDADEALRLGLVHSVHEDGDATLEAALAMADKIAEASPHAVRQTLASLRVPADERLERALQREADAQAHCFGHDEYKEGLDALEERRDPKF